MEAAHVWAERDKLIRSCTPLSHVLSQPFEDFQGFMDACGQRDPFAFDVAKGFLRLTEQSPGTGRASAIKRIFPRTRCHLSTPTLCWVLGIEATISFSRAMRWGGRAIFMLTESTIHLSMV